MIRREPKEIPTIDVFASAKDEFKIKICSLKEYLQELPETLNSGCRISSNQILLFSGGHGTVRIDNVKIPIKPKVLIPVGCNQVQLFKNPVDVEGYIIFFTGNFLSPSSETAHVFDGLTAFYMYSSLSAISLSDHDYNNIMMMLKLIRDETRHVENLDKSEIVKNIFSAVIHKLESYITLKKSGVTERRSDLQLIINFKDQLEKFFKTDRLVKSYAGRLFITTKKLNRITKSFYGKNAKQVIEDRTILEIKRMLIFTDLTINEISGLLNIDDPTNLVKFFKHHTNFTPAKYRNGNIL